MTEMTMMDVTVARILGEISGEIGLTQLEGMLSDDLYTYMASMRDDSEIPDAECRYVVADLRAIHDMLCVTRSAVGMLLREGSSVIPQVHTMMARAAKRHSGAITSILDEGTYYESACHAYAHVRIFLSLCETIRGIVYRDLA